MNDEKIRLLAAIIQNNSHTDYYYKKGWDDEEFYYFKPIILNQLDLYSTDEIYQREHIGLYYALQRILSENYDYSNLMLINIEIIEDNIGNEWVYDFRDKINEKQFRISINPKIISNTIVKAYDKGTFFEVKNIREAMELFKVKHYKETLVDKICDKIQILSFIVMGIVIVAMIIVMLLPMFYK